MKRHREPVCADFGDSSLPDETEFRFRSELLRRAALLMVPLSERPSLHGRIAQWLEQGFERGLEPRVPEALSGLLEYHYREARATQTTPQLEPLSLLTEP